MAKEQVAPGEVLVSLPSESVLLAMGMQEYPDQQNLELALEILYLKCRKVRQYQAWLESLPTSLQLCIPAFHFSEEELAASGDDFIVQKTQDFRWHMEREIKAVEELGLLSTLGASKDDFIWATSMAHSRAFGLGFDGIVLTPGIDMCNHSLSPTAIYRDPDMQLSSLFMGEATITDMDEDSELGFVLVAGDAGIRKGEEVTIDYSGERPDETYYSSFGFLPPEPSKTITVFHMNKQLNDSLAAMELPLHNSPLFSLEATAKGLEPAAEASLLQILEERLPAAEERRASKSRGGRKQKGSRKPPKPTRSVHMKKLWELLLHRCRRMLASREAAACRDPPPGDMSTNMQLSVELRKRQLVILRDLIPVCIRKLDAAADV